MPQPVRRFLLEVAIGALMLFLARSGSALDPNKAITQYHQDAWTERDGLPQGTVQAMTQTRDGYLWIGTRDGLARFDGVTFTVFRAAITEGLLANDIRALSEDRAGRLWIGTFNGGLSCYAEGKFRVYTAGEGLPGRGVLEILEARNGVVWFGTWDGRARFEGGESFPPHAPMASWVATVFPSARMRRASFGRQRKARCTGGSAIVSSP